MANTPASSQSTNANEPHFAHPSEAEFAQLLDYYNITWEYEPTNFILERDDEGKLLEAFSPDFYLVDQDLYIELTTARQRLIAHKRRKVRRLRELYPHINIKLINREDFEKLLHKYQREDQAPNLVGTVDKPAADK